MSFWKTAQHRGRMFGSTPVKKGVATGKRKTTPTFWRARGKRRK